MSDETPAQNPPGNPPGQSPGNPPVNPPVNPPSTVERELIYVADPMCSWCWGFSPVIRAVARQIASRVQADDALSGTVGMTPIMGGLRPLTRNPMTDDDKATIRHHWDEVGKRSGQPFDMSFFERDGFVYDTEPACRAVCLMRRTATDRTFDYLDRVQRAFYAENADVTDPDILAALAGEVAKADPEPFRRALAEPVSFYETAGDFHTSRQLGVTGYPTVILRSGKEFALLSQGFQPYDALKAAIDAWLEGTLATEDRAS